MQSYFLLPKDVRLNSTHYRRKEIHNERELQSIANNNSANIDYKDFMNIYRNYASEPYSFLTIDTTLPADNPLCFRKNLLNSFKKMTLSDETKTADDKVKANQAQY